MLVVAANVGRGTAWHHLGIRHRGAVGKIALDEVVERALEYLADLDELVHLWIGLLRLPLGDGLA